MKDYLKAYSLKKIIDFIAIFLVLCLIVILIVQPDKKQGLGGKKSISDYENAVTTLYTQNDSLTKLLNECQKNSLKTFLKSSYYYYEVTGKSDSISIKNLNVDLLFLKNASNIYLYLSIVEPKNRNINIKDIAYESFTHEDNFSWSDGKLPENKYVTISIEKLKSLDSNIVIEFTKPSTREIPPLGRLKLIMK
jgi:hypothetical protein